MNQRNRIGYNAVLFCIIGLFVFTNRITAQHSLLQTNPPDLIIEVIPDNLELRAGENGQVHITVQNTSDQTALNLRLSWINNTSLRISSDQGNIDQLSPNAEVAWNLTIAQSDQTIDAGKIYLQLEYDWIDNSLPEPLAIPRLQFSEIQVTAPPIESVDSVAGIEVISSLTTINEQRPGFLYIILKSKSDVPIVINGINLKTVDFINAESQGETKNITLLPNQAQIMPFKITVNNVVAPGKYTLLFKFDISWNRGGQIQTGTLDVSTELDIGIFGESQILTLLGIPAFFLLPGFLMIITFRLLWTIGRTKEETEKFPLASVSGEFLFVAITLSLLMALIYPQATYLLLKVKRNYLEAYGLADVLYLWFSSIVLAVFVYFAYYGLKASHRLYIQKQVAMKTPRQTDTPIITLRKLARQKLTMYRDQKKIKINGQEYYTFLLQETKQNGQVAYWVAPRIRITNREQIDELTDQKVCDLLQTGTEIDEFLNLSPKLEFAWSTNWPLPGPYQVENANVLGDEPPDVMVEFD